MYLNLSMNITFKKRLLQLKRLKHLVERKRIYNVSMDFEHFTIIGLIDTGALISAIPEADLNKLKLLANEAMKEPGPAPTFQIMVANGQLESRIGTVLLALEVTDCQL